MLLITRAFVCVRPASLAVRKGRAVRFQLSHPQLNYTPPVGLGKHVTIIPSGGMPLVWPHD